MIQFIRSLNDKGFVICIVFQIFRQAVRIGIKKFSHRFIFGHPLHCLQFHCHTLESGLRLYDSHYRQIIYFI